MFSRYVLATALVFAPIAAPGAAEAQKFSTVYQISLFGLPIAKSSFSGQINGTDFIIDGALRSSGIARVFDDTHGTTKVSGYVENASLVPISYLLNYRSGKKNKSTLIGFSGGTVTKTVNTPELKIRKQGWIPVAKDDLTRVGDPLTSTLVKADGLRDVCNRTIRIYDGEMRSDLKLSYAGIKPFSTRGFSGDVVKCNARFIPVSGYRKGSSGTEYLRSKSRMNVTFAPLGATGVFAPVMASIGTKIGTIQIRATRFGTVN